MHIQFDNVCMSYGDAEILRDISFAIEPGISLGVVGKSGSGKSTIARLMIRGMDPTGGKILIDHRPFPEYSQQSVLRHMGVIPQRPEMVSGDARENVTLAMHDEELAQVTDADLWGVLDTLTPVIRERFNGEGLDTLVGKQGLQLSGGQQQLICIARALVKNPALLIVDEATASLDAETEISVQEGIDVALSGSGGKSALVIAHRLSTQRNCDQIMILKRVSDCEPGESQIEMICDSPQEAYECSPTYRRLADLQGFRP